jgi:polyferredoxin
MDNRFLTILKFAAFLLVVMLAVVGLLWVLSLIGNELAGDILVKAVVIIFVITAASLLVSALMRPSKGEGGQPPEGQ